MVQPFDGPEGIQCAARQLRVAPCSVELHEFFLDLGIRERVQYMTLGLLLQIA